MVFKFIRFGRAQENARFATEACYTSIVKP
jgi:hypothetical protein